MGEELTIKLRLYEEGPARFYASPIEPGEEPSSSMPVFYNPAMKVNRDLAVAVYRAAGGGTAADVMAASGVRVIRLVLEGGCAEALANDRSPMAYLAMRMSFRESGVMDRVRLTMRDANLLMEELGASGARVDYLDLDPYGSPAPFLRSAVGAVRRGGVLAVTATDTAVLFGVYPHKTLRAYWAWGVKTDFMKELGARVLLGFIARVAASRDLWVEPLIYHATRHY
ncbi:MAG: tRNA (guanine-N2)-dimethyltransferase, partial [Thermoproteota archaeon]